MAAPTTIAERSPATASSLNYTGTDDGTSSTIHKMINLYPYFYKYSAGTSYQLNPDYEVHYVSLDAPNADGGHILNITLPYIDAYPSSQCLMVIYFRSSHPGDILTLTPVDAGCSINSGADAAPYSFTTDSQDHLFFVYGSYRIAASGNSINKYFVKQIQGREIAITAGTGIDVSVNNFAYTISAHAGVPICASYKTTASASENIGPSCSALLESYFIVPQPGKISNFYIFGTAPTGLNSVVYHVVKNGVAQALTITKLHLSSSEQSDTTPGHAFDVVAGDRITFNITQSIPEADLETSLSVLYKPSAV
jgi:hypothetical protein